MDQTTNLASLKKGREKRSITVRVVRKWPVKRDVGQGDTLYVGLILADAQANALYAEIPGDVIPKKEYLLDIGKVYIIRKFKVENARKTFRPIEKELMLEITEFTTIELARDYPQTIPEYVYSLTPFRSVVPAGKTIYKYTDVIGYITKYTALETFVPKNQEKVTNLRKIHIKDLSANELTVTLWGHHAINFSVDAVYNEAAGNVVVCLLVGCVPRRDYRDYDKIYLSGSSCFSYYLSPCIPEATPFHTSFKDSPVYIDRPAEVPQTSPTPVAAKPLKLMTVADLNAITDPFDFEDGTYKCAVTITTIPQNLCWWYISCKRHKKKALQQDDYTYRCQICNSPETIPRYLLTFIAKDDTGEAKFFAYDDEATRIVGRDCEAIMSPLRQSDGLPQHLQSIINKTYVFSVGLSNSVVRQYVVKAVLERPFKHSVQPDLHASTSHGKLQDEQMSGSVQIEAAALSAGAQQPPQHLSQIETTAQTTPPPSIQDDDSFPKDDDTRPQKLPRTEGTTRQRLFKETSTEEKIADENDLEPDSPIPDRNTTQDSPSVQPPPKRSKSGSDNKRSRSASVK